MAKKLFNELDTVTHHSIQDFLLDEEANIPRERLLIVGSVMVLLACVLSAQDAFAGHRSHSSHRSHYSHRSHSSHRSGVRHSSHSSSYHYHSNVMPPLTTLQEAKPVSPDLLKIPLTSYDTTPID